MKRLNNWQHVGIIVSVVGTSFSPVSYAKVEKQPNSWQYHADVYTEKGQINGCGISYVIVWQNDEKKFIKVSGSANFFLVNEKKNFGTALKAWGTYNSTPKRITSAWVETNKFGKTTDHSETPTKDAMGFTATKYDDPNGFGLPMEMAATGFLLGIHFDGLAMDEVVAVPPADQFIQAKLVACQGELFQRMKAVIE